jgi:tetratricopeptide (TPR) repeat protein
MLQGNVEESRAIYDQLLARFPRSPRALAGRGAIAAHHAKWSEARNLFNLALSEQPGYDLALAGLALCEDSAGEYQRGLEYYEEALKSNPENMRALLGVIELGYKNHQLSKVEGAIRGYLELHPADLEFVYSLAGCCYAQGKLKEALDEISKITLFNPNHAKAIELREMVRSKMSSVSFAHNS